MVRWSCEDETHVIAAGRAGPHDSGWWRGIRLVSMRHDASGQMLAMELSMAFSWARRLPATGHNF